MRTYLTFALLLFCNSLIAQTTSNKTVIVNPYLSHQNYEHFSRLVLSSTDPNIEFIEDFKFEWGYSYELSVKETKLDQMLSDGTEFTYKLNHIISKTKTEDPSPFKLFIDNERYDYELDSTEQDMNITLKALNDSTYMYFDQVEIEVPKNLKDEFDKIVSGKKTALGYFLCVNKNRIRLIHF